MVVGFYDSFLLTETEKGRFLMSVDTPVIKDCYNSCLNAFLKFSLKCHVHNSIEFMIISFSVTQEKSNLKRFFLFSCFS